MTQRIASLDPRLLPAGTYRVAAELDGVWHTRTIQAASAGRAARVRFVGRSD